MEYLIGIMGILLLGTVYVGLGLADHGRETCHDCSRAEEPGDCDACSPLAASNENPEMRNR